MNIEESTAIATRPSNGMQRAEPIIPEGVSLVRTEFGSREIQRQVETASTAVAAQAEATVKARFAMAKYAPRSMGDARLRVLAACKRPRFAKVARYSKPQGKTKIEGWSIRAAEEFARAFGNIDVQEAVIYDDTKQRIVRVTATDLESNYSITKEVVVAKTIERRFVKEGQVVLSRRVNTYGDTVYIVEPTDDELLTKQNALLSKARRNAILALIPGDILDEGLDEVTVAAANDDSKDPLAQLKKLQDKFATIGVKPSMIEQYLGHSLDVIGAHEIQDLRLVYTAIESGEAKWTDYAASTMEGAPVAANASEPPRTPADLKAREKAKRQAKEEEKTPSSAATSREPGAEG